MNIRYYEASVPQSGGEMNRESWLFFVRQVQNRAGGDSDTLVLSVVLSGWPEEDQAVLNEVLVDSYARLHETGVSTMTDADCASRAVWKAVEDAPAEFWPELRQRLVDVFGDHWVPYSSPFVCSDWQNLLELVQEVWDGVQANVDRTWRQQVDYLRNILERAGIDMRWDVLVALLSRGDNVDDGQSATYLAAFLWEGAGGHSEEMCAAIFESFRKEHWPRPIFAIW